MPSTDMADDAWSELARQELEALAALLDRPARKVFVFLVATDGTEETVIARASSGTTYIRHAEQFQAMLQHEAARLGDLIREAHNG